MWITSMLFVTLAHALTVPQAKLDLRAALKHNDGLTKAPAVREAIRALSELSPTERPA
eukprot:CAMPEP_0119292304 /NCGR_PEP_ID=MMETSP1329-20130426/43907_1 /TAXON_ID=114041 /ORGANISM="Genus nov. species nov., Strain RCC1024" /LENGTH=57 /DNA_ID=CAMNT_0007293139 /DNA_START=125 /DNA_END=294 /DNA_ORIENTATION=+